MTRSYIGSDLPKGICASLTLSKPRELLSRNSIHLQTSEVRGHRCDDSAVEQCVCCRVVTVVFEYVGREERLNYHLLDALGYAQRGDWTSGEWPMIALQKLIDGAV
jgi:hypothetical protein